MGTVWSIIGRRGEAGLKIFSQNISDRLTGLPDFDWFLTATLFGYPSYTKNTERLSQRREKKTSLPLPTQVWF